MSPSKLRLPAEAMVDTGAESSYTSPAALHDVVPPPSVVHPPCVAALPAPASRAVAMAHFSCSSTNDAKSAQAWSKTFLFHDLRRKPPTAGLEAFEVDSLDVGRCLRARSPP